MTQSFILVRPLKRSSRAGRAHLWTREFPATGVARLPRGEVSDMSEHENEEQGGRFAVPGDESIESPETLSPDEPGSEAAGDPAPPRTKPKQPAPEPTDE